MHLEVRNHGTIPESELSALFDPFRQGTTGQSSGLGLGLYIVRAIVEAHGGTVDARSEDGVTRFRVMLPRNALPRHAEPSDAEAEAESRAPH